MPTQHTQLLQYLLTHNIIDSQLHDQLQSCDYKTVVQVLADSKVLTFAQLEKLMSLFSGYPLWDGGVLRPSEQYQLLPLTVAQDARVVVAQDAGGADCLLTDQVAPSFDVGSYVPKQWQVYYASPDQIDQYLDWYSSHEQENLHSSIEALSNRIRTVDSFGFENITEVPRDYLQEIAEDISSEKLLKRLVELSDRKGADQIVLQPQQDSLLVRMRINNRMFDVVRLSGSVHMALYIKLRYLCDASFAPLKTSEKHLTGLLRHKEERGVKDNVMITFIPVQEGVSISIDTRVYSAEHMYTEQLGLSLDDTGALQECIRNNAAMILVSGKPQSGKTFAYYRLLEAIATHYNVVSLEDQTEYVLDKVDQVDSNNITVLRSLREMSHVYQSIAMSQADKNTLIPLVNYSRNKTVVLQHQAGVADVLSSLVDMGLSKEVLAQLPLYNLVSHKFEYINQEHSRRVSLNAQEVELLEEQISVPEFRNLLANNGFSDADTAQWKTFKWLVQQDTPKRGWGVRSWLYAKSPKHIPQESCFVRAFIALQPLVADAVHSQKSLLQLSQAIQQKQKRQIVETAVIRAARGEISIYQVLDMLRK